MREPQSGIYLIANAASGDFYLGASRDIYRRLRVHFWRLRRGEHANPRLQASFAKYGAAAFVTATLCRVSVAELVETEQALLDRFVGHPSCLNIARDAVSPMRGRKLSPAAVERIRAANSGRQKSPQEIERLRTALTGRVITPEAREKTRATLRARMPELREVYRRAALNLSPEVRARISAAQRNRSPEWRANISAAKRGVPATADGVAKRSAANRGKTRTPEQRARIRAGVLASRDRLRAEGRPLNQWG